jgi:O-antigen/teichoic acid export membrane protein
MASRKGAILRTAASSVLLRAVSLACTLVQVPVVMPYLGRERFGFWLVLVAIGSFFGLSDLGISSAFQNDVTLAEARGERGRLRPMFLTAQTVILVLALAGAALFTGVSALVGHATFFRNLSPDLIGQAVPLTATFVFAGALNAPVALSGRLAFGLHLGHVANLTAMVAQLLTLAAMVCAVVLRAPFVVFLLVTTVPTFCCNLVLGIRLLARLDPSPQKKWEGVAYAKHTVRSGAQFLVLGASQPLFFALGPLLLSSAFGPAVVTAYGLATRALGVVHNLEAGILGATWPVLTEALAHGNHARARRCLRRNVILTCFAFCLPVLLFPFLGPPVLAWWSGLSTGSFPQWIVWPVTLLFFCVLFQGPFYIALSAAGFVSVLAASHVFAAVAALGAAVCWHNSPEAIPACIAGAFAIFGLFPAILETRRVFRPAPLR